MKKLFNTKCNCCGDSFIPTDKTILYCSIVCRKTSKSKNFSNTIEKIKEVKAASYSMNPKLL